MKKINLSFLIILLTSFSALSQQLGIIPKPAYVEEKQGFFTLNSSTMIQVSESRGEECAYFLNDFYKNHFNLSLDVKKDTGYAIKDNSKNNVIRFVLDESYKNEAYLLQIEEKVIEIRGNEAGLFYGLQSLLQLLPANGEGEVRLSQVIIKDAPRFEYRGAMLDVGRYFFTKEEVCRFLDLMAYHKLNRFHWHLTEDAGWRMEIKKYPLLTQIGAWRRGTQIDHRHESFDKLPHGGYYTQQQIRDIVDYAHKRNITVIPEIDMPGHMLALLAAYPDVSCTGGPFGVLEYWGIQKDVLCAGNEKTYEMVEGILEEVIDLFPSEIIHVGGDEAPKDRWKACAKCQAKIKSENLKNEEELQSYFIKRVGAYLQSKGRKMIGWDEIMEGGLAPNAMVMSWRGEEGGIEAAKQHHEVVMSPTSFMYLDYYQGRQEGEPVNIGGDLPLEKVYEYEPLSSKIPQENQKYVIGVQGNLWMEYIHSLPKLDYMAFPRLQAVAEVGWSSGVKDFSDFQNRLSHNLEWMDKFNVNFRIPDPEGMSGVVSADKEVIVDLVPPVNGAHIYYTLDGRDPMQYGELFTTPVKINLNAQDVVELKCIVRTRTGRVSGEKSAVFSLKKD